MNARRRLLAAAPLLLGSPAVTWLAGCSSEALVRVPASAFGAPAEAALWGLDEASAGVLAQKAWRLAAELDQAYLRPDEALHATLAAAPGVREPLALDLALRGLALDRLAAALKAPELQGCLLTLGQHLLALGERGFRPWHVGVPDPHDGQPIANFDLYDQERLVTVASYARYRLDLNRQAPPPAGAGACASCSVVLRGQGLLAAQQASVLYRASATQWPAVAQALGATQVLWIGRDGRIETTPLFGKRLQLADRRRPVHERQPA